jgi:hypothetical protein
MEWIESLLRRVGLWVCALGWHRAPLLKEPKPGDMDTAEFAFRPLYRCPRCGLVGDLDARGNLGPYDWARTT